MPEGQTREIANRQRTDIAQETARDTSTAVIGALVGLVLGGAPGAIAGAAAPPVLTGAARMVADVLARRRQRVEAIVEQAMRTHSLSPAQAVHQLNESPRAADDFVAVLSQAIASDRSTDGVISAALGELLVSRDDIHRERVLIVLDALRGLRSTHMRVLRALHRAGGVMTAAAVAVDVAIPEVELRGVVRELELRGMIKDSGKHPIEWKIRELGRAIMTFDRTRPVEPLP